MKLVLWHKERAGFEFKDKKELDQFIKEIKRRAADIRKLRGAKDFALLFEVDSVEAPITPEIVIHDS